MDLAVRGETRRARSATITIRNLSVLKNQYRADISRAVAKDALNLLQSEMQIVKKRFT